MPTNGIKEHYGLVKPAKVENIFDPQSVEEVQIATIENAVAWAVSDFLKKVVKQPTIIHMDSGDLDALRKALQRRYDLETEKNVPERTVKRKPNTYGTFEFMGAEVRSGCSIKPGKIVVVWWDEPEVPGDEDDE